ncbi:hypothetical protein FOA52_010570 [Chlamydomonas sp. UWO 241]|nr:hypothetical protein FOA52_010570 [Chlamydomonas sp. UWO 241]
MPRGRTTRHATDQNRLTDDSRSMPPPTSARSEDVPLISTPAFWFFLIAMVGLLPVILELAPHVCLLARELASLVVTASAAAALLISGVFASAASLAATWASTARTEAVVVSIPLGLALALYLAEMDSHEVNPATERIDDATERGNVATKCSGSTTSGILDNLTPAYLTGSKPAVDAGSAWRTRKPYGVACLSPDEEHEASAASAASEAIKACKECAVKFKLSAAAISWVLSPAHMLSSPAGSAAAAPTAPEVSAAAAPSVFIVAKQPTV